MNTESSIESSAIDKLSIVQFEVHPTRLDVPAVERDRFCRNEFGRGRVQFDVARNWSVWYSWKSKPTACSLFKQNDDYSKIIFYDCPKNFKKRKNNRSRFSFANTKTAAFVWSCFRTNPVPFSIRVVAQLYPCRRSDRVCILWTCSATTRSIRFCLPRSIRSAMRVWTTRTEIFGKKDLGFESNSIWPN